MSEEVKEGSESAKKKGKLPIILMLVLLLGGGGFFAMKSKSGDTKKVLVKAGTVEPLDKEFLINLSNPNVYLRTEISVELRDGYKKEELDANMPLIKNCVIQIFRSKSLQEVGAGESESLRKEIGDAINEILIAHMKEDEKKEQAEIEKSLEPDSKKADGKSKDGSKSKGDDEKDSKSKDVPKEDWACPAGPVLNVYFTSFTTQ